MILFFCLSKDNPIVDNNFIINSDINQLENKNENIGLLNPIKKEYISDFNSEKDLIGIFPIIEGNENIDFIQEEIQNIHEKNVL